MLLSHAEIARDGRSGRSYFFHYDDCARFRVRECAGGLQLQVVSVCSRRSVLAGFDRPNWFRLGHSFAARGVLFLELRPGHARVIAGSASVTLYTESGPGRSRPQLLSAVSALRPFGEGSRRLRRTQRAYRRHGTVSGAALALGITPDRVRRRLRLAAGVDALPRVRTLRCAR